MPVITETRTITTPNATMIALATPSLGSRELSTWRVHMQPGATGPVHTIDREQIWVPLDGTFEMTINGETRTLVPGQAAIVPAGANRQGRTGAVPAEALVSMPIGGMAHARGAEALVPLPWAE